MKLSTLKTSACTVYKDQIITFMLTYKSYKFVTFFPFKVCLCQFFF